MYGTSELDELFQILNSVKGFKLNNHTGTTQQYSHTQSSFSTPLPQEPLQYNDPFVLSPEDFFQSKGDVRVKGT